MFSDRRRILLFANALSLAHPTRMWKIAGDLHSLGHEVHFATASDYQKYLLPENKDIKLYDISAAPAKIFNQRLFKAQFIFTTEEMIRDVQEDTALIAKVQPDVIFSDLRPTALVPARINDIPFINVTQYHWNHGFEDKGLLPPILPVMTFGRTLAGFFEPLVTPLILKIMIKKANDFFCNHPLTEKAGLKKFETLSDFYLAGDHVFFADLPALYPDAQLPEHQHFIGPVIWHNTATPWPEGWPTVFGDKPVAYVTMGSTGAHTTVPAILGALRQAGYQILLSGYGSDTSALDTTDVWLAPFVPGDAVLKKASLIVCNGGTGTTYHALSHGVPIIAIAQNMDQVLHSDQLTQMGVARMIYADKVTSEKLAIEIEKLTKSAQTPRAMHDIQEKINGLDQKERLEKYLKTV